MIKCIVSVVSSCSYDKPKREIQFHWNRENIVNVEITNKRTEKKNNNNKNTKKNALTWKWVKYANILSTILLSMGNHRNNETTNRIDIRRERKFPQWSESNHWTQETFEIQRGHNSKKSNVLHFHAILMNGMIFTAYNRTLCTRCSNQILCKKHYFFVLFALALNSHLCLAPSSMRNNFVFIMQYRCYQMAKPFISRNVPANKKYQLFASKNNRIGFPRERKKTNEPTQKICMWNQQFNQSFTTIFLRLVGMRWIWIVHAKRLHVENHPHMWRFKHMEPRNICWIADNISDCLHSRHSGSVRTHTFLTDFTLLHDTLTYLVVSLTTKALNDRHKVICL